MNSKKGFTLIELLIVLVIIGILAAVATPLYLANTKRAKMSEAVATLSLMRQAQRDFFLNHNAYFDILEVTTQNLLAGNIRNGFPSSMTNVNTGVPNPTTAGLDLNVGVVQYFSNAAFFADANTSSSAITTLSSQFTNPGPVDFIVKAQGINSFPCPSTTVVGDSCSLHKSDVNLFEAEMDNSGRIFVCYGTTAAPCTTSTNWSAW